jgi:hypothetical protein
MPYNSDVPRLTNLRQPVKASSYDTLPFERFIVFANPKSSGYRQAHRKIQELVQLFPNIPINTFETSSGGTNSYSKLLHKHVNMFGPRTLLCIAAGDGSINFLLEAFLLDDSLPPHVRQTPLLPLWGGNGNDLASMLNGLVTRTFMHTIFDTAIVVPVRAMHFRMVQPDGKSIDRVAAVTASFGASAQVARRLNDGVYRKSPLHKIPGGRYVKESFTAWWALTTSPTFRGERAGKVKRVYEYTFCNGPRMAKWYRMPVRLSDDQFFLSVMEGKVALITPAILTLSFRRRPSNSNLYSTMQFDVNELVWAQFDGEPQLIQANTKVFVQLSDEPFYVFSRLLADTKNL